MSFCVPYNVSDIHIYCYYVVAAWFIENYICTRMTNCFSAHENTWVSAETVRRENTYFILFLTVHNETITDDKNDDLYTSSPCLTRPVFVLPMTSQSIAEDVTMARQLNVITWIMISNLLDIGFIHGDIHGRSCKIWCFYTSKSTAEQVQNLNRISKWYIWAVFECVKTVFVVKYCNIQAQNQSRRHLWQFSSNEITTD